MRVIRGEKSQRDTRANREVDPEFERLQTEVERLRNELFLAREELVRTRQQARIDASARLIEALGHELRTSLTLMLGWTELLGSGALPRESHAQVLDSIYTAGWRIEAALRWLERVSERRSPPNSGSLLIYSATGSADGDGAVPASSA